MKSYLVITNEAEKCIGKLLSEILEAGEYGEIIIFDNCSKDETVPQIISTMGILWADKEERYKFYINKKKEDKKTLREKAVSIAKYEPIIIECFNDGEEMIKDVENK